MFFIEDMLSDIKDLIEGAGGIIFAMLLFFGIGMYFVFTLDPFIGSLMLFIVAMLFVAIIAYRIVSFFTGD